MKGDPVSEQAQGELDILDEALDFFKALAHVQRLKILGLLASRPAVVEEMAGALALSPATVSHHLRLLRQAGIVESRSDQQYRIYQLRPSKLNQMARELLRLENLREGAGPFPEGAFQAKVLRTFVERGKLRAIPAQRKKRLVILEWLVLQFKPGRRYAETEVNGILSRYHEDYCTLRRELVMARLLEREQGVYWRRP